MPLRDANVDIEVLCYDKFLVVAGARSRWARRGKMLLADLEQEPWVMFPKDSLIEKHFSQALRADGSWVAAGAITSFSMHVRMQLLATGRFLTILHSSTLRYYAKPWLLKALPVDLAIPPVPIAVFTLRNRTLSPVVRLFIEQARAVSKSLIKDKRPQQLQGRSSPLG